MIGLSNRDLRELLPDGSGKHDCSRNITRPARNARKKPAWGIAPIARTAGWVRTRGVCSTSPRSMAPLATESEGFRLSGVRAQTNRVCRRFGLGYPGRKVINERAPLRVPPTWEPAVEQTV